MRFNPKSTRNSSSKYIINNFGVLKYREGVLSKKRNFSRERDLFGEKSESGLGSFLNLLIEYLIPLIFIFKDSNILYNNKSSLKEYFLWNSLINSNILI